MKKFGLVALTLLCCSVTGWAKSPAMIADVVQLVGPYHISGQQAQVSVVNLYLPKNSVGIIGLDGGDQFREVHRNNNQLNWDVAANKQSVFIRNDLKPGTVSPMAIATECGLSLSVNIVSLPENAKLEQIKPKLQITSAGCPQS